MKKKSLFICLLITLIFVNLYKSISYATTVNVTDENLNATFQKFVSSNANENNYKIAVSNNIVTISVDGETYNLHYNLGEKVTFSLEIPITQEMSYESFKEQEDSLILPMVGYIAVANIQGVEFKDAGAYFLMSYMENALSDSATSQNSYEIIDGTDNSYGVNTNQPEKDISEMDKNVMEYVNTTYRDKQTITDSSKDGINSYEWAIERKDITDTSCKLVSTLSVNVNADYSKIKGYSDIKVDNNNNIDNIQKDDLETKEIQENSNTISDLKVLPKTGEERNLFLIMLYTLIGLSIIGIIGFVYLLKKRDN